MIDYAVIGHIDTHGKSRDGGEVAEAFLTAIGNRRLIVITSEHQNEGKSTTSRLLAERISEKGKPVLLIEGDMYHRVMSLAHSRIVYHKGPRKPYIETARHYKGYEIVSFNDRVKEPQEIISSEEFATLMRDAKDRYEVVIIDTPPVGHHNDAVEISKLADGVVFVHAQSRPEITTEMENVLGVITTSAAGR